MTTFRYLAIIVVVGSLIVTPGCVGNATDGTPEGTTTIQWTVLTVHTANPSGVSAAPNKTKRQFMTLTAAQQAEFQRALEQDVENPSAWEDGSNIEYVEYNGTWYTAEVVIVN